MSIIFMTTGVTRPIEMILPKVWHIIISLKMSEEYLNASILPRLEENEEFTRDIITNLDSFFLTVNGSLIILMQVWKD